MHCLSADFMRSLISTSGALLFYRSFLVKNGKFKNAKNVYEQNMFGSPVL